jgi:hypothetical protein
LLNHVTSPFFRRKPETERGATRMA